MALTGLNSRGYKNSTLLFNLARIFIARSPARGADQPALDRHRRADVAADADPPSLGLLRCVLHRGAVELCRDRPRLARSGRGVARARSPTWSSSASSPAARRCARRTASPSTSSPRWRRCRIRASRRFFAQIKQDLGFGVYVPDCDTTACAFSAATQAGSDDPILDQPLLDFYAGYQVARRRQRAAGDGAAQRQHRLRRRRRHLDRQSPPANGRSATTSIRRSISTSSKSVSATASAGRSSRRRSGSHTVQRIIGFQKRLVASGAFTDPRSHIYYLPELYCAYFGRCYAAFIALPPAAQTGDRPRRRVRFHPRPGAGLCPGRIDRRRDERVRCGAGADRARPSRRRCRRPSRRRCTASSAISAKAAGTGRSRPMNGTR